MAGKRDAGSDGIGRCFEKAFCADFLAGANLQDTEP
jgi:hypothetical protein